MKWILKMFALSVAMAGMLSTTGCGRAESMAIQYADTAMGTVMQMNCYAVDAERAESFFDDAMAGLNQLEEERLSWRLESSEVFRINAAAGAGEGIVISPELEHILVRCLDVWEKSDGAFDVTLGAVARLWNIDGAASGTVPEEEFTLPSNEQLMHALEKCGSGKLRLEEDAVQKKLYLPHEVQLDLGAVGKGIALDEIYTRLENQAGITGAVFSAGGSILLYGSKPENANWRVGIVNPFDAAASIGTLVLDASGWYITTSGDYERYIEIDGVRYHHIFDPATGYPAQSGVRGVTILTKEGLLGDALSTACFVLGAEEGMNLIEKYEAEALFVLADGEIILSDGLKETGTGVYIVSEWGGAE